MRLQLYHGFSEILDADLPMDDNESTNTNVSNIAQSCQLNKTSVSTSKTLADQDQRHGLGDKIILEQRKMEKTSCYYDTNDHKLSPITKSGGLPFENVVNLNINEDNEH